MPSELRCSCGEARIVAGGHLRDRPRYPLVEAAFAPTDPTMQGVVEPWPHQDDSYGGCITCEFPDETRRPFPCAAEQMRLRAIEAERRAETAEDMLEDLTVANVAAGDEARRANRAEDRAIEAERRLGEARAALTDEDEIAHGEAVVERDGRRIEMNICAYCRSEWPCHTQRAIDRLLARLSSEQEPR